jgi:hypothetical protein
MRLLLKRFAIAASSQEGCDTTQEFLSGTMRIVGPVEGQNMAKLLEVCQRF